MRVCVRVCDYGPVKKKPITEEWLCFKFWSTVIKFRSTQRDRYQFFLVVFLLN